MRRMYYDTVGHLKVCSGRFQRRYRCSSAPLVSAITRARHVERTDVIARRRDGPCVQAAAASCSMRPATSPALALDAFPPSARFFTPWLMLVRRNRFEREIPIQIGQSRARGLLAIDVYDLVERWDARSGEISIADPRTV